MEVKIQLNELVQHVCAQSAFIHAQNSDEYLLTSDNSKLIKHYLTLALHDVVLRTAGYVNDWSINNDELIINYESDKNLNEAVFDTLVYYALKCYYTKIDDFRYNWMRSRAHLVLILSGPITT